MTHIRWERVPIVIAVYTGIWLLVLYPWREFWPGLLLNPYLLFLYFGLIALVAIRLRLDYFQQMENRKLRWLFMSKRVEGLIRSRDESTPLDTNIKIKSDHGITPRD